MSAMNRTMKSNVIDLLDDSDSEVVCLFSRKPLLSKKRNFEIVDVDTSDDEILLLSNKPPSHVDNRAHSGISGIKKTNRPSSKWNGQSTAKKIKIGFEKAVAVHKTAVSKFASVRTDSNDARPLKKTGSSGSSHPHKPSYNVQNNTSKDVDRTKPKSILRPAARIPVLSSTTTTSQKRPSSSQPTPRTTKPLTQRTIIGNTDSSSTVHGSQKSSECCRNVVDVHGTVRPPTPPIPSGTTTKGTDMAQKSLPRPKSSDSCSQNERVQIQQPADQNPLVSVQQSSSIPRTNHGERLQYIDNSATTSSHRSDLHVPSVPHTADSPTRQLPTSKINQGLSPSDAVDLFIYPMPDDFDLLERLCPVKDQKTTIRSSTPPLVNFRIDQVNVDNVLFDPESVHLELAPSDDSETTNQTPMASSSSSSSCNDLTCNDGDHSTCHASMTQKEAISEIITDTIVNDACTHSPQTEHLDPRNEVYETHSIVHPSSPTPANTANNRLQQINSDNVTNIEQNAPELTSHLECDVANEPSIPSLIPHQKQQEKDNHQSLFRPSLPNMDMPPSSTFNGEEQSLEVPIQTYLQRCDGNNVSSCPSSPLKDQTTKEYLPYVENQNNSVQSPTLLMVNHQVQSINQHDMINEPYTEQPMFPLGISEDSNWLSEFHCFVRANLVEVFCVNLNDVKSHHNSIVCQKVGLQCRFCAHLPSIGRSRRFYSFPSSLCQLSHMVDTLRRDHFPDCLAIPATVRMQLDDLRGRSAPEVYNAQHYWIYAAKKVGMFDTSNGIMMTQMSRYEGSKMESFGSVVGQAWEDDTRRNESLVDPSDKNLIAQFLYRVLSQAQPICLTETECVGPRRSWSVGLPGLGCRYCCVQRRLGLSRIYPAHRLELPQSVKDLYQHLRRCTLCPQDVKDSIERSKSRMSVLRLDDRASNKKFYDCVWSRLTSWDSTNRTLTASTDKPPHVPPLVNNTLKWTRSDDLSLKSVTMNEQLVQQKLSHRSDKNSTLGTGASVAILERTDPPPKSDQMGTNPRSDAECVLRTSPLRRCNVLRTDRDDSLLTDSNDPPEAHISPLANPRPKLIDDANNFVLHVDCGDAVLRDRSASEERATQLSSFLPTHCNGQHTDTDEVHEYPSSEPFDADTIPCSDHAISPILEPSQAMFWSDCNEQINAENSSHSQQENPPVDDQDKELPASMVIIPHLSRKTINKATKLPTWEFTVYGEDDSIIYSFRAFAAKSKLPGAGTGAFLEFMGAKRLHEWSNERRLHLLSKLDPYESLTMQPLQAYPRENGSGVTVYLKGNDLHGNNNRNFKLKQLLAVVPKASNRVKSTFKKKNEMLIVRLKSAEDLQLNIEYEANCILDQSPLCPIGHLGVQTDCDYVVDSSVTEFFSDMNCIDLGRYGPFHKTDRKPEDLFVIKSFIFSNVPGEWSFGALEMLHGMQQIIDITDDTTGTPTSTARKEIPMYVNEVGYNTSFMQNVYIKDSFDERSIRYYFLPDAPMQKGVPVELLTNYRSAYETVRERKGYGRSNIENGLKSDLCRATFLQRNFLEREDIENIVDECTSVRRLGYLLYSIDRKIFVPLTEMLENGQQLTALQWVAVRRIQWTINVFRRNKRSSHLEEKLNEMEKRFADVALPYLRSDQQNRTFPHIDDKIKSAMNLELLEEICYPIRLKLPHILDKTRYYPAAIQLIHSLCRSIAQMLILQGPGHDTMALYGKFIEDALHAKNASSVGSQESHDMQLTQVVMIIDAFATEYLKKNAYSMRSLCVTLDFDYQKASAAAKSLQNLLDKQINERDHKPHARKDGKRTGPTYGKAELVYSGPPTIPFPGNGIHWPNGWIQESYQRSSGATKGRIDCYWYPPEGKPKLRSRVEIRTYLARQAHIKTADM